MNATRQPERQVNRRSVLTGLGAFTVFGSGHPVNGASPSTAMEIEVSQKVTALLRGRKVKLRLLLPEGSEANVSPVIKRFSELTGIGITVTKSPADDLTTELMLDALAQSRQFDVALPATFGVPDLVANGALYKIDEYVDRHEPAGFRDGSLFRNGDSFDGHTYGFQTDGDAYLMFYNKRFLEDSSLQSQYEDTFQVPLRKPNTWQELDQQMAFFNSPDQGRWGGLLFRTPGYLAWEWWIRFHAKGIWPFSPSMDPQISSDLGVEALEGMIRATEALCPDSQHLGLFENWERYSKGDVYCNIGWGGSQKYYNRPESLIRGSMVYGPTPGGYVDDQLLTTPYFNWGWNYVVPSGSTEPEIAYLFALFASTPAMSTLAVRQQDGYFDPFRLEHYEDSGIQNAYSPDFLDVHRASLKSAIPDLYLKNRSEYFRILNEWLAKALRGEVPAKTALTRVSQRWQLITQRSGRQDQIKRWGQLRQQYPLQVRSLLRDAA